MVIIFIFRKENIISIINYNNIFHKNFIFINPLKPTQKSIMSCLDNILINIHLFKYKNYKKYL